MKRIFVRPMPLALLLLVLTAIPIVIALVRVVQIPAGQLPPDAAKFAAVPWALFLHALGGSLFGILGPVQFAGVLKRRFGRAHRITGRIFVVAGLFMALSSLRLLWQFPDATTWIAGIARLGAGAALGLALIAALRFARARNIPRHRAWMIRAYAIGMGPAAVSLMLFPIFVVTGEPPVGVLADLLFVLSWVVNIAIAEWVIRRTGPARSLIPARVQTPA